MKTLVSTAIAAVLAIAGPAYAAADFAGAPEGSGNVLASADQPEGSGSIVASADQPEGSGSTLASADQPEGSGNVTA